MRALLASPLGFLIGVSLGALGGGGSILAVPALVYVAGEAPKQAITTSLVVVGVTALAGMVTHLRAGHVRLGSGTAFGAAGLGGAVLGSALNQYANDDLLMLGFAALMLIAAWRMLRRRIPAATTEDAPAPATTPTGSVAPDNGAGGGGTAVATAVRTRPTTALVVRLLAAGSVVGLITGFFGVGGGFVIVPALVLVLDFSMEEAVGTSLLVIAINSAVALVSRMGTTGVDWGIAIPFTVAGLLGASVGARIGERISETTLTRLFVSLLLVLAAVLVTTSTVSLITS